MKIAIVKLSAMGDIIHAMTALQYLKAVNPHIQIDWITEEVFAPILEYNPDIDTILPVNLKGLKKRRSQFFIEVKKIRTYAKNNYDLVVDVQGLLKSSVVSRIIGKTVGFDAQSSREPIASLFYSKCFQIPYEMNVIERNIKLILQAIGSSDKGIDLMTKKPFLFFAESERKNILHFLKKRGAHIVHFLGSSWESKVYPKEKFLQVIQGLEGNHLLVWGSEEEKKSAEYIASRSNAEVVPRLTLGELKALISSADLVIGGDSGPTHMAWALNRPSIMLFGPTLATRSTLQTTINRVVDCGKEIDPKNIDKKDFCIGNIPAEKVISLAKELGV
ncbi:MAG: lipopolysaccharide heptosyltransferase I [Sulfurovum sp.]|nr:lipopolysaccharide heptosyltransferase I [Sulfurovum sp.]MCB4753026.1 lipopolysaccharide heptosyltransferase I [Sulfurovum sp.]